MNDRFDQPWEPIKPLVVPAEQCATTVLNDKKHDPASVVLGLRVLPDGNSYLFDRFTFQGQPRRFVTLGRSPTANIHLDEPAVSYEQCLIERRGPWCVIYDCGSTNGTRVNGVPVKEGLLEPGMILTVGTICLLAYGTRGMDEHMQLLAVTLRSYVQNAAKMNGTSVRRTAAAIDMPRSTLQGWLNGKFRIDDAKAQATYGRR